MRIFRPFTPTSEPDEMEKEVRAVKDFGKVHFTEFNNLDA